MSSLVCVLTLIGPTAYGDYISDPRPLCRPNMEPGKSKPRLAAPGSSRVTSSEPAPLPVSPPPSSPRREAGRRVSDAERTPVKAWYVLTSHPGYEGFGARNARGEVVVEWHRRIGTNVLEPGPVPDAAAPSCSNGQCPAPSYYVPRRFAGSKW